MTFTAFKNFDNFQNFDWDLMKSFYFVAKAGTFLEAAKFLGVSSPTLTRQVQALEKQVGFPLLIRYVSKGVMATRKGEELLDFMESTMMPWVRGYTTGLDAITNKPRKRKVKITATHASTAYVLNEHILDFYQMNFDITSDTTFEVIADDSLTDIVLKDADIGIQPLDSNRSGRKVRGVQIDYLYSISKKLYASTNYINTYGEPQAVDDLINHHVVAFPQSEAYVNNKDINWILTVGMPQGKLRVPTYTSNSIECLIKAAERGIGIIGSYENYEIIKMSTLKNILPDVKEAPLKSYFIYHDHLKNDKIVMGLKDYLMEKLNS